MRDEGVRGSERVVGRWRSHTRPHALRRPQPAQQEGILLQNIWQTGEYATMKINWLNNVNFLEKRLKSL